MAITAQNVVDSVSQDIRKLLASSGADAAILLDYVDRIHKDALHQSIYSHLNRGVSTLSVVANTISYSFAPSPAARRVFLVYDKTIQKVLFPFETLYGSTEHPQQGHESSAQLRDEAQARFDRRLKSLSGTPEFFMHLGTNIYLIPTPKQTASVDVYYEKEVVTIAALGTSLTLPEDSKDMVVAGVNMLACQYLKRDSETAFWQREYERMKRGL